MFGPVRLNTGTHKNVERLRKEMNRPLHIFAFTFFNVQFKHGEEWANVFVYGSFWHF